MDADKALEWARGCDGKVPFEDADEAAREMARLARRDRSKLNVYRCAFCKHWHIGHVKY